jgi:DNA-binding transcriptional LysR family regulator
MANIRKIDLNLLLAFDALYELNNVSRAADRLNLTQPTVSGMLNRLREVFKDPLFVRTQHGVLPTPRADELAEHIKTALSNIEYLLEPRDFNPQKSELFFSISANDYMQQVLLVPFIAALQKQAPNIKVAVLPASPKSMSRELALSSVDLAITIPEFTDDSLRSSLLYSERYVCVARENHPLSGTRLSLKEFCSYDHCVVSPSGGSFSGPADIALKKIGRSRRVRVSTPSFQLLLDVVRNGDFLALVPELLVKEKMQGLKLFECPMSVPNFDVIACWHSRLDADLAHRWLRGLLKSTVQTI